MSILKEYHAELVKVRPEAAETMPFDTLVKDVAVAFNLFWYAQSLPCLCGRCVLLWAPGLAAWWYLPVC